ncbi:MAG: hypothetical protein PF694_06860 [Bacteroidetes bacterium]|jgi:hypothetical protein|nr:hypothetical protein [Bacteroidota bacterium]
MKRLVFIILAVVLLGCNKDDEILNNQGWIEDIEYIQQELPQKHPNLFFKITEEVFNREIDELKSEVPHLTENQILVELMKIFSHLGDSHTGILNSDNLDFFTKSPVKFEVFNDGIYITDIIESGKSYLQQKVVAINNTPIDTIRQKFKTIVPHENEYHVKAFTSYLLRMYQVLNGMGISAATKYTIHLENGVEFTVGGNAMDEITSFYSAYDINNFPLYRKNNDLNYWYEILDSNIVYLQYNLCYNMDSYSFNSLIDVLFYELEHLTVDKFILDIRLNVGGSSSVIIPLIEKLSECDELDGKIYCCIGASTFSSGLLAAISSKENLNAILVGEPTGGKPNHYGDVLSFTLPNSGLVVHYSTKYVAAYSDDTISAFYPDYFVENYSEDSFNGIDSAIEFIKQN